jgi:hypothetical protein
MPTWTDEDKKKVIAAYKAADPTAETSTEIIKEIAEDTGFTANGIRMILVQAGVYVKKEVASSSSKSSTTKEGGGTRVSKESQIAALKAILTDNGIEPDDEILDKLTGKAAGYLAGVITQIAEGRGDE